MMMLPILVTTLASALPLRSARAQALASPTAHWGAHMLPDLGDRDDFSVHFLDFTRYGKEVRTVGGTREYWFTPYNDMRETLGFNILSYSRMRNGIRLGDRSANVDPGPLSGRTTLMLGFINDVVPEFLQNEVIHRSNLKSDKLERVPRRTTDTFDDISHGPSYYWPPIVGWSQEYFMRLYASRRIDGEEQRVPTPLFLGGGLQLSTINQEFFVHAGANVLEVPIPDKLDMGFLRGVGLGGMARAGALSPGHYLKDLTSHYTNVQAVVRANVEIRGFAMQLDYTMTGASGFFVAPRTPAQRQIIAEFPVDTDPAERYQAKSPVSERFSSLRARIGDFTFEMYNDSFGGKDKGPSYGTYAAYNVHRPNGRIPGIDWLFDRFGRGDDDGR
jgi:hypothetical protein